VRLVTPKTADQFFQKVLNADHTVTPRVMTVDQPAAYPPAFEAFQLAELLPKTCPLRPYTYLNNIIKQDHRLVKRRVSPGVGSGAFATAERTIQGDEVMPILRKGQVRVMATGDVLTQNPIINQLFEVAASRPIAQPLLTLQSVFATRPPVAREL
jgi:IS6 family transposase